MQRHPFRGRRDLGAHILGAVAKQAADTLRLANHIFSGAHAAVLGCGVLTRDACRYRSCFPSVAVVAPER